MHILHLIPSLNIGGAENFVVQLANAQSDTHTITIGILGQTDPKKNFSNAITSAVHIHPFNWTKKYTITQLFELYNYINKTKPDVIHFHLTQAMIYTHGIALLKPKIKYIHTVHNSYSNWKNRLTWLNRLRYLMRTSVLHVCISPSIYKDIHNGFPKLKSTMIRNGINAHIPMRDDAAIAKLWQTHTGATTRGIRFVNIGNISKYKNHKLLALSFDAIHKEYPEISCLHFGRPSRPDLVEELKQINAPNLFFAGSHEKAADFLTQADAMVISSTQEGMPIVALEALSLGIPIISTPAGGMVDIITNGYNGFITKDTSVRTLVTAICKYINLPTSKKVALSQHAKESFETYYTIDIITKQYNNRYRN